MGGLPLSNWPGGSLLRTFELGKPGNLVHLSTFRGSSERAVRGLPHPVCEKEGEGWRKIHHPQGFGDAF